MKKIFLTIITTLFLSTQALASDPAVEFVSTLADRIILDVLESKETREKKLETFREDFNDALDLKSIGQFVLGRYWKTTNEKDREDFLKAFTNFTTLSWSDRFDQYNGQKITFSVSRNAEGNQLYIDSQIMNRGSPVEVIWRVRQKDNNYKIIDIIVEGVSMAMSYRNEYTAVLQKNSGDVSKLTNELNEKAKNFKFTDHTKEVSKK